MKRFKYYIQSFRLRTLPLSLSGIFLGSLLATADGEVNGWRFVLAVLTTLCLQILSNLANELGDLKKGTDNENRLGPIRSIQSGALGVREFYRIIICFAGLSLIFGSVLVYIAFRSLLSWNSFIMLLLGAGAVVAAVKYTMGRDAYGYRGLGDLFVFLFFGLVSTVGAWFLMTARIEAAVFLPAMSIGLLSTGVLNLNNIRDIENDRVCGKRTIPVIIGEEHAKVYHYFLIGGAVVSMLCYAYLFPNSGYGYLFLFTVPLLWVHLERVRNYSGRAIDSQLKFLSLITLAFALLSGVGQVI